MDINAEGKSNKCESDNEPNLEAIFASTLLPGLNSKLRQRSTSPPGKKVNFDLGLGRNSSRRSSILSVIQRSKLSLHGYIQITRVIRMFYQFFRQRVKVVYCIMFLLYKWKKNHHRQSKKGLTAWHTCRASWFFSSQLALIVIERYHKYMVFWSFCNAFASLL